MRASTLTVIRQKVFKLTQARFGSLLNLSQATISKWESGVSSPNLQQLCQIRSLALKIDPSFDSSSFFECDGTSAPSHSGAAA